MPDRYGGNNNANAPDPFGRYGGGANTRPGQASADPITTSENTSLTGGSAYTVNPDGTVTGADGHIYTPPSQEEIGRAERGNNFLGTLSINNGVWWTRERLQDGTYGPWRLDLSKTLNETTKEVGLTAGDTVLANIRDKIELYLDRPATMAEMQTFKQQSDYRLMDYIRRQAEYGNSQEYQQAQAKLNDLSHIIWGKDIDAAQADEMIRGNWSLEHVQDFWRNSDEYKAMYEGKPVGMDEQTYNDRLNYFKTEADNQRFLHAKWAPNGVVPDNAGLKKAWMDDLSEEHGNAIKYKGWEAIHNFLQQRHGTNSLVTLSAAGPMEGLMKGSSDISSNVGGNGQALPASNMDRYATLPADPTGTNPDSNVSGAPVSSLAGVRPLR